VAFLRRYLRIALAGLLVSPVACQDVAAPPNGDGAKTVTAPTSQARMTSAASDAPGEPPAPSAPDGAKDSSCADIEKGWREALQRYANKPVHDCRRDEDCGCYGGFKCPNALIDICPSPLRADVADELAGFDERWHAKRCGTILWSPHSICQDKCVGGRCR